MHIIQHHARVRVPPAAGASPFRFLQLARSRAAAHFPLNASTTSIASHGPHVLIDHANAALLAAATFDSASPAYVAIRWIWFSASTGLIGAVTFRVLILPRCTIDAQSKTAMIRAATRIGITAATLSLFSGLARWAAQTIAVFGTLSTDAWILLSTGWGRGLILHGASAALALLALPLARRANRTGWGLAALAALAAATAPAYSGHAAAAQLQPWAVLADALHVLAAGAWIGSLGVLAAVTFRTVRQPGPESAHPDLATAVHAFSPVALASAAILLLSGGFSSWIHLRSLSAIVGSGYGRILLLKLAGVGVVAAVGAWNWRRVRPDLGTPPASVRLRASARSELAFALLVLLLTAVLVAMEPPFAG
jgi:copper transport protein